VRIFDGAFNVAIQASRGGSDTICHSLGSSNHPGCGDNIQPKNTMPEAGKSSGNFDQAKQAHPQR